MEKPLEGASLAQAEKNDCCSQGMRLFPMFLHMGVSKNRGTPKSCILMGFSIINHPFWGVFTLFLETPTFFRDFFRTKTVRSIVKTEVETEKPGQGLIKERCWNMNC